MSRKTQAQIEKEIKRINDNWLKKKQPMKPDDRHPWKLDLQRDHLKKKIKNG